MGTGYFGKVVEKKTHLSYSELGTLLLLYMDKDEARARMADAFY